MAKTPIIRKPEVVAEALSVLEHRKKLKVSFHVAKTFENVGLIASVSDSSGRGRARKNHELTPLGQKVLERSRKATEQYAATMDKIYDLYDPDKKTPAKKPTAAPAAAAATATADTKTSDVEKPSTAKKAATEQKESV